MLPLVLFSWISAQKQTIDFAYLFSYRFTTFAQDNKLFDILYTEENTVTYWALI